MSGFDIRIARMKLGIKQWRFAAQIDVPQTILCAIETGKRTASPTLLKRILAVLQQAHSGEAVSRSEQI